VSEAEKEYSKHFTAAGAAEAYDRFYETGTADDALWQIERALLAECVQEVCTGRDCSYLDFACGTGRVIAFIEQHVAKSLGIDISPEMLALARSKVRRSQLICCDVLRDPPPEKFDVITAFRFFLNAEPSLRTAVMRTLASLLRDRTSRLIFTNHGNPFSYKAALWPYHRARALRRGSARAGNYLTHGEVLTLLRDSGLEIVEREGYGFISPRLFRSAPAAAHAFERRLAGVPLLGAFGVNQMYIVRIKA
jgi:SAM-dependent methyltransferase